MTATNQQFEMNETTELTPLLEICGITIIVVKKCRDIKMTDAIHTGPAVT